MLGREGEKASKRQGMPWQTDFYPVLVLGRIALPYEGAGPHRGAGKNRATRESRNLSSTVARVWRKALEAFPGLQFCTGSASVWGFLEKKKEEKSKEIQPSKGKKIGSLSLNCIDAIGPAHGRAHRGMLSLLDEVEQRVWQHLAQLLSLLSFLLGQRAPFSGSNHSHHFILKP